MLLIAVSIAMGLALGLRYRVFILVPVILAGTFAICATTPQPFWQAWTSVVTFSVLLQIAYIGGALLRFATRGGVAAQVPAQLSRSH